MCELVIKTAIGNGDIKMSDKEIPIEILEKIAKDQDLLLSDNLINFAKELQNYLRKNK